MEAKLFIGFVYPTGLAVDNMKERGRFIVLEGGVGAGKTTVIEGLQRKLSGWEFYREPGGTPFGDKVRDAVMGNYGYPVDKYAAMFGYTTSRANLIRGVIIPLIEKGKNVVLDRYWYSTYAYQGSEGVPKLLIWAVSVVATRNLKPDLVLHYDLVPEMGKKRKENCTNDDRYDLKELEFHRKVRKNYLELRRLYPGIWHTIDASQPPERVLEATLTVLRKHNLL